MKTIGKYIASHPVELWKTCTHEEPTAEGRRAGAVAPNPPFITLHCMPLQEKQQTILLQQTMLLQQTILVQVS